MASDKQRAWKERGFTQQPQTGMPRPKLTPRQREEIVARLAADETPQVLAAEYGVSVRTIYAFR